MKNIKFFSLLMIAATSLLFVQCTTDPIPGPDGTNGVDGVNGTTECAACHNISTSESVHASYLYSGHAKGGAVGYAGNRGGCADCHSNEGYIDYMTLGASNPGGYEGMATPVSCTTCHGEHATFDFENDGYDYALRWLGGTTLITDETYTIDYEGSSNSCTFCHQPRRTMVDNGSGFVAVSEHWGPHHGPQSIVLEGIQGQELAGTVEYPAPATAAHRTGSSCTSCHMDDPSGTTNGDHTWVVSDATACSACHTSGIPEDVTGFEENMHDLLVILEDVGILHGEINDEGEFEVHPVVGEWPILESQAAWNYLLLMEDSSQGVHNPKYANALLENSIEALSAD